MEVEQLFALVFVIGMFSGLFVVFLGIRQRSQQLEMQHRERMAMIERGQIPLESPSHRRGGGVSRSAAGFRSISLGIIVMAVGLGLMSIISIAAESPEVGVGIGGAVVIVGAAFLAVGMVKRHQESHVASPSRDDIDRDPGL